MSEFSVIIVSWNVADSLERCIKSVLNTKYPDLEIIVVDNASTDNSLQVIRKFRSIKLIKNLRNVGFPKSVNIGLRQSKGDYLAVLNPDTIVPENFFTSALRFFKDNPEAWLMGPKLTDPDGRIQGSVFPEPSTKDTFREFWMGKKGLTAKFTPPGDIPVKVNSISGSCLVFPRSTQERTGLMTEKVFMYYEDLDFCRRIRKLGGFVYFNPEIVVIHEHGSSSKKTPLAHKYLHDSSLWYNGFFKHWILYLITRTGQVLHL
jgi:hypothetical protein